MVYYLFINTEPEGPDKEQDMMTWAEKQAEDVVRFEREAAKQAERIAQFMAETPAVPTQAEAAAATIGHTYSVSEVRPGIWSITFRTSTWETAFPPRREGPLDPRQCCTSFPFWRGPDYDY